jgi:hypothetical protein
MNAHVVRWLEKSTDPRAILARAWTGDVESALFLPLDLPGKQRATLLVLLKKPRPRGRR